MNHLHYEPCVTWACDECGKSGDVSIPPASYTSATEWELAASAHAAADPVCAQEWGNRFVRVSQGIYPD